MNPEEFDNQENLTESQTSEQAQAPQDASGDMPQTADAGTDASGDMPQTADAGTNGAPAMKNRKPLIIGAIAACAVVLAVLLAVFIPKLLVSDKARVAKGFGMLTADLNDASLPSVSEYLGFSELKKQTAVSAELNLNLEKLPGDSIPYPQLDGTGLQYLIQMDPAAKNMRVKGNIKFGTLLSVGAVATWKDDKLFVEVPDFFEGSIALETKNIKEQMDNSLFAGSVDIPEDFTLDIFGNEQGKQEQEIIKNFQENLALKNKPAFTQVWEKAEVSKTKEKKDAQVGAQTLPSWEYKITIPKEEYTAALNQLKSFIMEDESSEAFFDWLENQTAIYSMSMSSGMDASALDELDARAELTDALDSYIENVNALETGLDIHVRLLKDGRIASLSAANWPDTAAGETISLDVSMTGEPRLCDATKLTMTSSDSPTPIVLSYDRTAGETDLFSTVSLDFTDDESGAPYTLAYSGSFDTADGSFSCELSVDDGEGPVALAAEGSFADVTPGQTYTLYVDSLSLGFEGDTIEFSGDYHQEPLSGPIEEPAAVSYELFKMTEDDLTSLIGEVYQNAAVLLPFLS